MQDNTVAEFAALRFCKVNDPLTLEPCTADKVVEESDAFRLLSATAKPVNDNTDTRSNAINEIALKFFILFCCNSAVTTTI